MGDNRNGPHGTRGRRATIAGYDACRSTIEVGPERLAWWEVADLERYVDRDALLRADDPPEPPYWAHCWAGARLLAERLPAATGRVIEVGCGLGLPGIVAARRGAGVVFVDRVPAPLAFVRETLRTNGLRATGLVVADVLAMPSRARFDLVLAAEVLYDRSGFDPMARALAALVAPGGHILLADAHRIDTAAFYDAALAAGLTCAREDVRVVDEGFHTTITMVTMRPPTP